MEYPTSGFTYVRTDDHGDGLHKDVVFLCELFVYSARCFENIIQFIKGQRPEEPLSDGSTPTLDQLGKHDRRRELYNGNHKPLQDWIDNLL